MEWGRKWLVNFNAGKTQLISFDRCNNIGAIDVKMDGSALEENSFFNMLGLGLGWGWAFFSELDWGSYTISIAKTASKKIGALIRSKKFLSPEVALYLCKSTIRSCMEYCCHVWAGAPSCYCISLTTFDMWKDLQPFIITFPNPLEQPRLSISCLNSGWLGLIKLTVLEWKQW